MKRAENLYKKAKKIIPGGTQLLSKRPELFLPDLWPTYYSKAKGCKIWDLDGKKYYDMNNMGIGSCILGYADKDVNKTVKKVVDSANMASLNAPEEIELAELLLKLHPWAKMVRFARTGGEALAISVRIARAFARKDIVLFCGYHGWHDWYLSANLAQNKALDGHLLPGLSPLGVPRQLKGSAYPFNYNDTAGFLKLINKYGTKIGVVVLETVRNQYPAKEFLQTIRLVTKQKKIVLICDEVSSGFRLNLGGAHLVFNLHPDIAVFAKGMSNGYPMAAVIGRKNIMQKAQETFISSTYWTERIGPAAALATLKKMKAKKVPKHLNRIGKLIQNGWGKAALKHGLKIEISGIPALSHFSFNYKNGLALKTLFTQLMLQKGFLAATALYVSYAHKDKHIKEYLKAVDQVFSFIAKKNVINNPEQYLKGPVCHSGFKRLT